MVEIEARVVVVGEVKEAEEDRRRRKLWLRVLQQCVAEADGRQLYGVSRVDAPGVIYRAQKFLTRKSKSLIETCSLAGLGAEQIRLLLEQNRGKYCGNSGKH